MYNVNCKKIQGEQLDGENNWKNIAVGFYVSIVGFSVFINIESVPVSVF